MIAYLTGINLNAMKYLLSIVLFFLGFSGLAQEVETYLLFDAEKADRYQMEKEFPLRAGRGTGSLSLPFFDDFSTYSLPTSDPEIPVEYAIQNFGHTTLFLAENQQDDGIKEEGDTSS